MSKDDVITHAEALRLIDEQIGERVYLGLFVARGASEWRDEEDPIPFIHLVARLENPFAPKPPRLDADVGYYGFGRGGVDSYSFAPMAGTIHLRDNGLDFRIADGVSIRIAWRGSEEVGDSHPDAGELAWLRRMGAADEVPKDHPGLARFLAKARRARAEILEASPTDLKIGSGEEERRIWSVRVRVEPEDGPAFEATVERGWRLESAIEEKIERGDFLTGVPASREELEVAYDPRDHEQIIVYPNGEGGVERTIRFRATIIGRSVGSADDDRPRP
jgi:hypothetical protein